MAALRLMQNSTKILKWFIFIWTGFGWIQRHTISHMVADRHSKWFTSCAQLGYIYIHLSTKLQTKYKKRPQNNAFFETKSRLYKTSFNVLPRAFFFRSVSKEDSLITASTRRRKPNQNLFSTRSVSQVLGVISSLQKGREWVVLPSDACTTRRRGMNSGVAALVTVTQMRLPEDRGGGGWAASGWYYSDCVR